MESKKKNTKVLVTGASGFVGSHIVEALLERNYQVSCLLRKNSRLLNLEGNSELSSGLQIVRLSSNSGSSDSSFSGSSNGFSGSSSSSSSSSSLDSSNEWDSPAELKMALKGIDFIIHCGGQVRGRNLEDYRKGNVFPTEALLKHADPSFLKGFLLISSQASAGPSESSEKAITETDSPNPLSNYGRSKREAEELVLSYRDRFPVAILRPCSIYGPRDRAFLELFRWIDKGLEFRIGKALRRLNMIYIEDFVRSVLLALESERSPIFFSKIASLPDFSAVSPPDSLLGSSFTATITTGSTVSSSDSIFFVNDGEVYDWNSIWNTAKRSFSLIENGEKQEKIKKMETKSRVQEYRLSQTKKTLLIRIPVPLCRGIARIGDLVGRISGQIPVLTSDKLSDMLAQNWLCDSSKIRKEWSFQTRYSLEEGFFKTLSWYKQEGWL